MSNNKNTTHISEHTIEGVDSYVIRLVEPYNGPDINDLHDEITRSKDVSTGLHLRLRTDLKPSCHNQQSNDSKQRETHKPSMFYRHGSLGTYL